MKTSFNPNDPEIVRHRKERAYSLLKRARETADPAEALMMRAAGVSTPLYILGVDVVGALETEIGELRLRERVR